MPLRHDVRRGALLMLAATFIFTVMGAVAKHLSVRIPFAEVMFFRNLLALPVVLAIAASRSGGVTLRTRQIGSHVARAGTGLLAMTSSFYALSVMPIADQTALSYTTPLFVVALSVPFLGERPGAARIAAVGVGFAGVVVVALGQGAFGGSGVAWRDYAIAAGHGFWAGLTTLLVRQLSATESSATIVLWQSLLMTAATALFLPFVWVTPSGWEWPLLLAVGLIGGVGQVLLTEAYASAQVSSLGPYSYSALLWAMLLGFLFFGEVPGAGMLAGAALIVGAGLFVARADLLRRRPGGGGSPP